MLMLLYDVICISLLSPRTLLLWMPSQPVVESSWRTADLYESIGFSTDVKGLPALMQKIKGLGDPGCNRDGW